MVVLVSLGFLLFYNASLFSAAFLILECAFHFLLTISFWAFLSQSPSRLPDTVLIAQINS